MILVINPGSTSTRLALHDGKTLVASREFQHDKEELAALGSVMAQKDFRMAAIRKVLSESALYQGSLTAVAGRGGLLHPLKGGVYKVSDEMIDDLQQARYGEHPCNLGAVLAREVAREHGVDAYIVDPVVTDEMADVARMTGLPAIRRRSLFHALSQRGAARTVAGRLGVDYGESNFIVCHMGGGVSVGAHRRGRVVDVINALDGEGPFSPERTGGLPLLPVLDMIERDHVPPAEVREIVQRRGGMFAHLGTNDLREVVRRMDAGDEAARAVFKGMAYGIAKNIASLVPALADGRGRADLAAVVLTGGMARSRVLTGELDRLCRSLGPVEVVDEEEEMAALATGVVRVLRGEEMERPYGRVP